MKGKVIFNRKRMFIFFIVLVITNLFGFYNDLPISNKLYFTDFQHIFVWVISIFSIFITLLLNKGKIYVTRDYRLLFVSLLSILFIEIIVSYRSYGQPLHLVIKESFYYTTPFIAYFAYEAIKNELSNEVLFEFIVKLSIVCSCIAITAFIFYTYLNINFLNLNITKVRNGSIRFNIGGVLLYVGLIISFVRTILKKNTKYDTVNIIISSFQIVIINKTRTNIFYFAILFILMILFEKKAKRIVKYGLVLLLIILIIGILTSVDTLSESLSLYAKNDAGIMIRFETINFYVGQFLKKPMLGMGFISTSKDLVGWQLLYGSRGYYYRNDVGIIGYLNEFGIVGIIWMICLYVSLIKKMRIVKKTKKIDYSILKYFIIYILITMINLMFLDVERIMILFFIFAVLSNSMKREIGMSSKTAFVL